MMMMMTDQIRSDQISGNVSFLARASRMVQHFHGQLSGLVIEQKEELQRSSNCVRDCHQYLDIIDLEKEDGLVSWKQD